MLSRYLPTTRSARVALLLIALAAIAAGIGVGRGHAYNQSVGGMTAAFGGILFVLAAFGLLVFGIAAWVVTRLVPMPAGSAGRAFGIALIGVVLGFPIGLVTAEATGGTYREPVVPSSPGAITAAISMPGTPFVPRPDGPAQCAAGPDGETIGTVTADDMGKLGVGTLRAFFTWDAGATTVAVELWVDAAESPDGLSPTWSGTGTFADASADGLRATVVLGRVAPVADPKLPTPPPEWAGDLTGTVTWTCGALS